MTHSWCAFCPCASGWHREPVRVEPNLLCTLAESSGLRWCGKSPVTGQQAGQGSHHHTAASMSPFIAQGGQLSPTPPQHGIVVGQDTGIPNSHNQPLDTPLASDLPALHQAKFQGQPLPAHLAEAACRLMFSQYLPCTWQLLRHELLQCHQLPNGNLCYSSKTPVLWVSAVEKARRQNSACGGKRGHLNRRDVPMRGGSVALCWRQEKAETTRAAGKCRVKEICTAPSSDRGTRSSTLGHRWKQPLESISPPHHPGHTQPQACVMAQWRWDLREDWVFQMLE